MLDTVVYNDLPEVITMTRFLIGLLSFFFTGSISAQDPTSKPIVGKGDLHFFADAAGFRGPEQGITRLEVFALVNARQFAWVPQEGQYVAQYDLTIKAVSENLKTIKSETWIRSLKLNGAPNKEEGSVPYRDRVWLDLPPGRYHLGVEMEDMYGDQSGSGQVWVEVIDFEQDALLFSDLLVAGEIHTNEGGGRFGRYGWNVIPNTTHRYSVGKSIPLYCELYNLKTSDPERGYVVGYSLTDSSGVKIKKYPVQKYRIPGASAVQTAELKTDGIDAGVYWIQAEAFDRVGKRAARARRQVVLVSDKNPAPEMSESQADQLRYYKDIRYVATNREHKTYERLPDESAKMNFLKKFWKQKDPTPDTPVNARLIQHIQRMKHVEANFTSNNVQHAIDTDRGRIYIIHGPPDEIEYHTSASTDKSAEIWHYGQYIFIFRDPNGLGLYRLMHSTFPGELYNPDWEMQTY